MLESTMVHNKTLVTLEESSNTFPVYIIRVEQGNRIVHQYTIPVYSSALFTYNCIVNALQRRAVPVNYQRHITQPK